MRILYQPGPRSGKSAAVAQVTYSEGGGYGALGGAEYRSPPVFAPRGIAYRPCEGDNLLLIPADGADVCAGVLCSAGQLAPGELRLSSAGGASVVLQANGDVVINGVTITKDGEILAAGVEG